MNKIVERLQNGIIKENPTFVLMLGMCPTLAVIVIVASFVTIVQFLVQGFIPSLYSALGIYIPLIVVNCIILGRAESYASKNPVIPSIFDGLGMGLGFTVGLTSIGIVREILGAGQIFGFQILPLADAATGKAGYTPITIFVLAPGAFFVLAFLIALMNVIRANAEKKGKHIAPATGCLAGDCESCGMGSCSGKSNVSVAKAETKTEAKDKE